MLKCLISQYDEHLLATIFLMRYGSFNWLGATMVIYLAENWTIDARPIW